MEIRERLEGIVTHYRGNGRRLGYPTANIDTETELPDGVYFGYAELGQFRNHPAVVFIGTPTTKGVADDVRRVEAHLISIPDADYYGQRLILEVHHFHRHNKQFDSVEDLMQAIDADEIAARSWFVRKG